MPVKMWERRNCRCIMCRQTYGGHQRCWIDIKQSSGSKKKKNTGRPSVSSTNMMWQENLWMKMKVNVYSFIRTHACNEFYGCCCVCYPFWMCVRGSPLAQENKNKLRRSFLTPICLPALSHRTSYTHTIHKYPFHKYTMILHECNTKPAAGFLVLCIYNLHHCLYSHCFWSTVYSSLFLHLSSLSLSLCLNLSPFFNTTSLRIVYRVTLKNSFDSA